MKATLAIVGKVFGQLALVQGSNMIDIVGPFTIYRGDAATLRLTVTDDDDARIDLTGATIELQVKAGIGDADPALIAKAIGTGVTLLDQTAPDTKGQADIAIAGGDTDRAPGLYWLDVVVTPLAGDRQHVITPIELTIGGVVNLP